jgi:putative Mg2+ transporter-C (MgtC) family protein
MSTAILTDWDMVLRLLLAAALGAIIGYQREREKRPAGLRTHMLICMGSALFTLIDIFGYADNQAKISAGIVTGIGFLGAGAILHREGGIVVGLTTAASIWIVAGIGLAAGTGQLLLSLVATVLTLIVLLLPHPIR